MLALVQNSSNTDSVMFPLAKENQSAAICVSMPQKNTESELWDQFRGGDDLAFASIYNDYVDHLFNYGKKFSQDRELIKDCIHDFFVYLREKRDRLSQTTSIKYYLLRSFRRRLFKYIEKNKKNSYNSDILSFEIEFEDCGTEKFINEEATSYAVDKLNISMQKLGNKEREAIYFYYYEGLSYKEIAEIMQFTHVSSARRLIYIALDKLKGILS